MIRIQLRFRFRFWWKENGEVGRGDMVMAIKI